MDRPFQFRLRTLIAVMLGIGCLLGVLRWLDRDAVVAIVLLATAAKGAILGKRLGSRWRGALLGLVVPIFYVLSIHVAEHIGHRAGWPSSSWACCSIYESLWYRQSPFGSDAMARLVAVDDVV